MVTGSTRCMQKRVKGFDGVDGPNHRLLTKTLLIPTTQPPSIIEGHSLSLSPLCPLCVVLRYE